MPAAPKQGAAGGIPWPQCVYCDEPAPPHLFYGLDEAGNLMCMWCHDAPAEPFPPEGEDPED